MAEDKDKQKQDKQDSAAKPKAAAKPRAAAKPKEAAAKPKEAAAKPKTAAKPKAAPKKKAPAKPTAKAKADLAAKPEKAAAKPKPKPEVELEEPVKPPIVRASAKYVRSSARKARLVADHIRGKDVLEARSVLQFTQRAVARDFDKLLASALANAENNHELEGDDLRIAELRVDEGPTIKRYRPRAMGRATPIMKRTCHMSIALEPKQVRH